MANPEFHRWHFDSKYIGADQVSILDGDGNAVARVIWHGDADDQTETARVICAAWPMLESLESLLPHLPREWSEPGAGMADRVRAAHAAVDKARGYVAPPALPWAVVDEEAPGNPAVLARFATQAEAEAFVGMLATGDAAKVERGGFGIDGPAE